MIVGIYFHICDISFLINFTFILSFKDKKKPLSWKSGINYELRNLRVIERSRNAQQRSSHHLFGGSFYDDLQRHLWRFKKDVMIVCLNAKFICKHIHDINVVPNYKER